MILIELINFPLCRCSGLPLKAFTGRQVIKLPVYHSTALLHWSMQSLKTSGSKISVKMFRFFKKNVNVNNNHNTITSSIFLDTCYGPMLNINVLETIRFSSNHEPVKNFSTICSSQDKTSKALWVKGNN